MHAGRVLARLLTSHQGRPGLLVLGLPRGGMPVAAVVAEHLEAPLDAFLVRKLGVPGREELAMGAVASGGVRVLNDDVIRNLAIPPHVLAAATAAAEGELRRQEARYRGDRPPVDVAGRSVIVVDDGLATGSTMRAAVAALRLLEPASVTVAVPTAPRQTVARLRDEADEVVAASQPEPFLAVGYSYDDFAPTTDEEVRRLLAPRR
ncbi:MAG: phosphoribosyltransferase [Acidimicrobiales bacterium]